MKLRLVRRRQIELGRGASREISTRSADKGGGLLQEAIVEPWNLLFSADDGYLFLVHGYANSKGDAAVGYRKLTQRLSFQWQARVVHVFWPGDGSNVDRDRVDNSWLYPLRRISRYAWQPARAKESARLIHERIAEAVARRSAVKGHEGSPTRPIRIYVVAHSLGCRLTLELLALLKGVLIANPGAIEIRLTVLMAAAIPLYLVADRAPLAAALGIPERMLVYYSERDRALGLAFRAGQSAESIQPSWPLSPSRRAIGRDGVAEVKGRREVYHTAIGHSDYWPSQHVAGDIADALAALPGPAGDRLIQSRFLREPAHWPPRWRQLGG